MMIFDVKKPIFLSILIFALTSCGGESNDTATSTPTDNPSARLQAAIDSACNNKCSTGDAANSPSEQLIATLKRNDPNSFENIDNLNPSAILQSTIKQLSPAGI